MLSKYKFYQLVLGLKYSTKAMIAQTLINWVPNNRRSNRQDNIIKVLLNSHDLRSVEYNFRVFLVHCEIYCREILCIKQFDLAVGKFKFTKFEIAKFVICEKNNALQYVHISTNRILVVKCSLYYIHNLMNWWELHQYLHTTAVVFSQH